jgi:hypothetical protein
MKSFLKVVVAGVVVLVASTAILITSSKSHKDTSTGISAEATPVAATADAGPTYHESSDAIDPYELVKNPYKFKGHSGILDTLNTPVLMGNGARMTSVAYPGGCLQFKKMLDEHTAIFEMMVYQEVLMPAGELAVILPDSNPPNSLQPWRVLIEGPYAAVNGLGNQITLTAVRFEGYYVPPKADATPQPPAAAATEDEAASLPKGSTKWKALSRTADAITGDIELSPYQINIANMSFPVTLARSLRVNELQVASHILSVSVTQGSVGRLYKTTIPATAVLKNGNTACGSEKVEWAVTMESPGDGLSMALFSGELEPIGQEQTGGTSTTLCGTFSYSWDASNAATAKPE